MVPCSAGVTIEAGGRVHHQRRRTQRRRPAIQHVPHRAGCRDPEVADERGRLVADVVVRRAGQFERGDLADQRRLSRFITNETSAGNSTITGTSISQTFTIPTGATQLRFDVRLLNNDDTDAFVTFDDFGGVALTQGSTVIAQFNADLDSGSSADLHVTAGAGAGGFVNSTGWSTRSFNVSGLVGQSVTLTVYAINYGGDNSVETRLLIDNIQLTGTAPPPVSTAPIPTLSQWALIGLVLLLALAAGAALRRRGRL
jgi:hypothetical protein